MLDKCRLDTYEHIRTWEDGEYRLELFDTFKTDRWGRSKLAYLFFCDDVLIFSGEDYGPAPSHAFDSDASVAGLLSFLAAQPGDTDDKYFADYTPAQLAFAKGHGECLSSYVEELERPY